MRLIFIYIYILAHIGMAYPFYLSDKYFFFNEFTIVIECKQVKLHLKREKKSVASINYFSTSLKYIDVSDNVLYFSKFYVFVNAIFTVLTYYFTMKCSNLVLVLFDYDIIYKLL